MINRFRWFFLFSFCLLAVGHANQLPNTNLIGPTPTDDRYRPDTELRQQNEVACAMRPDNSEHLFCAYNDYRGARDPDVGDGWIGVSQSRNAGQNFVSRLAPGWRNYGDQDGDGISESVGREFAADPSVAAAPGVMLTTFISTDRADKGPGGVYLQRWFETNTEDENGFTWVPEADTKLIAPGASGFFIDKPDTIFAPDNPDIVSGQNTLQTVNATLEGGEAISRQLIDGTIMVAYTVFADEEATFKEPDFSNGAYVDGQTLDGVADLDGSFVVEGSPSMITFDGPAQAMRFEQEGTADEATLVYPWNPDDVLNLVANISFDVLIESTENGNPGGEYIFDFGFAELTLRNEGSIGTWAIRYGGLVEGSATLDQPSIRGTFPLDTVIPIDFEPEFNRLFFGEEFGAELQWRRDPTNPNPFIADATHRTEFTGLDLGDGGQTGEGRQTVGAFITRLGGEIVGLKWFDEGQDLSDPNLEPADIFLPMFFAYPENQGRDDIYMPLAAPRVTTRRATATSEPDAMLLTEVIIEGSARTGSVFTTQSSDYGETWTPPRRLSGDAQNASGVRLAYTPGGGGGIMAVWRRFTENFDGDLIPSAMESAYTRDVGERWAFQFNAAGTEELDDLICPFDQLSDNSSFRTNAFPALTGLPNGGFALFWSQRGFAAADAVPNDCLSGYSRIVYSRYDGRWNFGGVLEDAPDLEGHQLMPQAFGAGDRAYVSWWDSRNDISQVFGPFINDQANPADPSELIRHSMDMRAMRIEQGFTTTPSIQISSYLQGSVEGNVEPLERNWVNARLFKQGTTPFVGDYNAVTGQEYTITTQGGFLKGVSLNGDGARPFYFAWADNRDVRGDNWGTIDNGSASEHAPVGVATSSAALADGPVAKNKALQRAKDFPEPVVPLAPEEELMCVDNNSPVRSRDQNIYGTMIFPGLDLQSVSAPKPTGSIQRAQVVFVRNFSETVQQYRLTIADQPADGRASFSQFPLPPYDGSEAAPVTEITLGVYPNMIAARSIYVSSEEQRARVPLQIEEIGPCEATNNCRVDGLVLNANPLAPGFQNPGIQNPGFQNPGFQNSPLISESRQPELGNPIITAGFQAPGFQNPGFQNPGFQNPGFQNPGFQNPGFQNPGIQNPGFQNPGFQNPGIQNPGFQNPGFQNPGFQNPGFQNPGFQNPGFQNQTLAFTSIANPGFQNSALDGADMSEITDITWPLTNSGNTTAAFDLRPLAAQIPQGASQLLVTRAAVQPTIRDCVYVSELRHTAIINIADPDFSGIYDPESQIGPEFASVAVGPYETLFVTLRLFGPADVDNFGLRVFNQACDTADVACTADPATRFSRLDAPDADPEPMLLEPGIDDLRARPKASKVQLNWSEVAAADGYDLYRQTDGAEPVLIAEGLQATVYQDTIGTDPAVIYTYNVIWRSDSDRSVDSNLVNVSYMPRRRR
ncbi:MAG: hypothetical protein AAF529_04785 [Pseudomonadota bacterium]